MYAHAGLCIYPVRDACEPRLPVLVYAYMYGNERLSLDAKIKSSCFVQKDGSMQVTVMLSECYKAARLICGKWTYVKPQLGRASCQVNHDMRERDNTCRGSGRMHARMRRPVPLAA
jgi:hypothetical protein